MKKLKLFILPLSVSIAFILYACNKSDHSNSTKNTEAMVSNESHLSSWSISNGLSQYQISKNSETVHGGKYSCLIKSKAGSDSFNGIVQTVVAKKYLGKRVLLSAYIKSEDIKGHGAIWMRADSDSGIVSFDNLSIGKVDRTIKGTGDWKKCEIVLDIPQNAQYIHLGAFLNGSGKMWLDDLSFTIVDPEKIEITGVLYHPAFNTTNTGNSENTSVINVAMERIAEMKQHDEDISKRTPLNLGFEE